VTDNGDSPAGDRPDDVPPGEQPDALTSDRAGEHGRDAAGQRIVLNPLARSGFIEYDRVLFFSDAVFAIAITLLAVSLRVPEQIEHGLSTGRALHQALPGIVGFWISFAVIGLFWIGHHGLFRYINALDRPLILMNLLFLGVIAFLPYPTEVLSKTPSSLSGAIIFYAACVAAAGIAELAIWLYATLRRTGLAESVTARVQLLYALRIARVPVVFLLSIPIALTSPQNAPYFWVLVWVSGLAINRFVRAPEPSRQ
jgi:TMEM175 potassium channel family protein